MGLDPGSRYGAFFWNLYSSGLPCPDVSFKARVSCLAQDKMAESCTITACASIGLHA